MRKIITVIAIFFSLSASAQKDTIVATIQFNQAALNALSEIINKSSAPHTLVMEFTAFINSKIEEQRKKKK